MAVAFRASVQDGNTSGTGSGAQAWPAGTAQDDIVLAFIYVETDNAVTQSGITDWTEIVNTDCNVTSQTHRLHVFWRRFTTGDGNWTFNWGASVWWDIQTRAYSGCKTSGSPIDASSSQAATVAGGNSNDVVCPTITLSAADDMLILAVSNWQGTTCAPVGSPPRGGTYANEVGDNRDVWAVNALCTSSGATGTINCDLGASSSWIGAQVALLSDAGTPPAITGSGGVAFAAPTLAGSGSETFTGTGGVSYAAPVLAGAGALTFAASGGVSFVAPTLAGEGAETFAGSGGVVFGAPVLAGEGTALLAITGDGAVTFAAPALSGSGATGDVFTGAGAVTFGAPTLEAVGAQTFDGQGAITFGAPVLGGVGAETFEAVGATAIPAPALSGTAALTFAALGAVLWQRPTLAGTGTVEVVGGAGDPIPAGRTQLLPPRSTTALLTARATTVTLPRRTTTVEMEAL
jgi:hypothetical protein